MTTQSNTDDDDGGSVRGVSLRDYFAAHALPALLASFYRGDNWEDFDDVAATCYRVVDAMLKARVA